MKKILLIFYLILNASSAYSQKLILSRGWTLFADFNVYEYTNSGGSNIIRGSYSPLTLDFGLRYAVYDFSDNSSISVSTYPAIGGAVNTRDETYMNFVIPLFAEWNIGALSNIDNLSDNGISLGIGLSIEKDGLINPGNESIGWGFTPTGKIDFRRWNRYNKLKEYSLRVGYGNVKYYNVNENGEIAYDASKLSVELFFRRYINF